MKITLQLKDLSLIAKDKSEKYTVLEKALAQKALEYHKIFQDKSDEANELFQSIYSSFCLFEKKGLILRLMEKRNHDPNYVKVIETPKEIDKDFSEK